MPISLRLSNLDILQAVFKWFNDLGARKISLTQQDVAKYFTANAVMITNSEVKCSGIDGHFKHFVEIGNKFKSWQSTPFLVTVNEGNKIAAHYFINFVTQDGSKGKVEVMAFSTISANKIERMVEVINITGATVKIENT